LRVIWIFEKKQNFFAEHFLQPEKFLLGSRKIFKHGCGTFTNFEERFDRNRVRLYARKCLPDFALRIYRSILLKPFLPDKVPTRSRQDVQATFRRAGRGKPAVGDSPPGYLISHPQIRTRTWLRFPLFPKPAAIIHENATTFPPFPLEFTPEKGRRIWQRLGGKTPPQTGFSSLRQGNRDIIAGRPLRAHVPVLRRGIPVPGWSCRACFILPVTGPVHWPGNL
jgi:hypothetical protein